MPIAVVYPQTAVRQGATPVQGTLVRVLDARTDVLTVTARVVVDGAVEAVAYTGAPGAPSEVGASDFEYRYYRRWDVPASVRVARFVERWQHDAGYVAAVVAGFFGVEDVRAVQALIEGHSA